MSDEQEQTFEETVNAFYPVDESEPLEAPTEETASDETPVEEDKVEETETDKAEEEANNEETKEEITKYIITAGVGTKEKVLEMAKIKAEDINDCVTEDNLIYFYWE